MDVKYCQEKHRPRENNPDIKEIYNSVREKNTERAQIYISECRMGYGYRKKFPVSGDRTGGMVPLPEPIFTFDRNGVPKMFYERNHPRIVQEPVTVFYFGANCDIKYLFTNTLLEKLVVEKGIKYEDWTDFLHKLCMDGLDEWWLHALIIDYTTSYATKGTASNDDHDKLLEDMMKAQLQKSGKEEEETTPLIPVTMNKMVGQFMIRLMKAV